MSAETKKIGTQCVRVSTRENADRTKPFRDVDFSVRAYPKEAKNQTWCTQLLIETMTFCSNPNQNIPPVQSSFSSFLAARLEKRWRVSFGLSLKNGRRNRRVRGSVNCLQMGVPQQANVSSYDVICFINRRQYMIVPKSSLPTRRITRNVGASAKRNTHSQMPIYI